jgi:electron transfer flavoprotein alpha/beta subunit
MAAPSTSQGARLVVFLQRLYEAPDRPAVAVLGHCERAALDTAVRLRDRLGARLTAVAMGADEHQRPVLAAAAAAGCDRCVRVHAPDCDELDYLGVATVLAAAARRLGCELALCGDTGENERTGAVGPALAELLGVAHLTGVLAVDGAGHGGAGGGPKTTSDTTSDATSDTTSDMTSDATRDTARALVVTHRSGGRIHRLRWPLPAVLCLLAPVTAPAQAAARDRAGATAIETLTLDELGLNARALAHRRRLLGRADTDVGRGALMVATADDLVARLVADGMLR